MTDTERKAMFNLAYLIKECIGKYISMHSPKGKPEFSLTQAGFPYTLKQFNIPYNYFALIKRGSDKESYDKLSDDEKVLYHKRFKYVSEVVYPKYLDSKLKPGEFVKLYFSSLVFAHVKKNVERLFGDMFYDDTLCYSEKVDPEFHKHPDYVRLNYFYEQLIHDSDIFNAQKRFNWIRTLFKLKDIEEVQPYIDVWKTNPDFYDDVLFKYKNDIHNSEWYVQKWNMGW